MVSSCPILLFFSFKSLMVLFDIFAISFFSFLAVWIFFKKVLRRSGRGNPTVPPMSHPTHKILLPVHSREPKPVNFLFVACAPVTDSTPVTSPVSGSTAPEPTPRAHGSGRTIFQLSESSGYPFSGQLPLRIVGISPLHSDQPPSLLRIQDDTANSGQSLQFERATVACCALEIKYLC